MNILLISECSKRALTETRRILDQFAERRGERTWQTPITQQGLSTLRRLLRKTARKNTAVACHWIRGKDHSELLWIVGDASRFNAQGAVPTNRTRSNILRTEDENDWHTGEDIRLLAQMAALMHDLGKSSVAFQQRLRQCGLVEKNLYRHEWVSLRLLHAFVGPDQTEDSGWLQRLADPTSEDDATWLKAGRYWCDGLDEKAPKPFQSLPPLAAAIGWLMVSHHRLPVLPVYEQGEQQWLGKRATDFKVARLPDLLASVEHDWNEQYRPAEPAQIEAYWQFKQALPVQMLPWRAQASKVARKLLALTSQPDKGRWLDNPYVMHLARLSLMLADHHYSSLPAAAQSEADPKALYANSDSSGQLKQTLEEHLLGVTQWAGRIGYGLMSFERHLPRLAKHRGLAKRTDKRAFFWQNKAAEAAAALRNRAAEQGAFIINMASTGCGKTLANARILYALSDPERGMRASFALGLRTLTLQTGRSYRQDLHLDEDELAIRVGGSASRALFEFYQEQAEAQGSASTQALLEEDSHVLYEGQMAEHPVLFAADPETRKLLSAPLLVCTIDHLIPATESLRAGRQIAPMLRLMSSDLVLDELDDFDLNDLPALTRLMYWAGLLGTRVLLSSATLPPALVEGMFLAYHAGRSQYQRNRGQPNAGRVPEIPCLWVDEFGVQSQGCTDAESLRQQHAAFVQQRVSKLKQQADKACRRGELIPLNLTASKEEALYRAFAESVQEAILKAHDRHAETCPHTGKKVSFGLVRMANIEPLFEVALALFKRGAPEGYRIHLCVYHARFPLILRSAIEQQLDGCLNRRTPQAVYERPEIRQILEQSPEPQHIFVVLGSPVTEVGRDHDYDWAVVEPSSMRSLIQLAGRVQRHRQWPCQTPNILIFDTNLRHFSQPGKAAFVKPGFERDGVAVSDEFRLNTHSLTQLLREEEYQGISACPRIEPHPEAKQQAKTSLVNLEHARMAVQMLPKDRTPQPPKRGVRSSCDLDAACGWQFPQALLTGVLPQQQPFRDDPNPDVEVLFLPDEDEEQLLFYRIHQEAKGRNPAIYTEAEHSLLERIDLEAQLGPRIEPWGQHDLMQLLEAQTEAQGQSLHRCAERFAVVAVPKSGQGWRYHPVLGFGKSR
ncbi:CRISPR-associated endonuclease/helicase Cas3 [Azomonas agilis]|uniref:CRISPR-associated endonuclease/helicase Cas3 n=1 Tax=Azomonas agilis TaxID=116849 RepID=A0A562J2F5_9GAMM|nr:type I-F CRISPR-associated helicase Cas3f [Azomonas agilis]TWH77303.1 CRISPR-associated endonuclease/helicase Cas3 [Azomonas agilis]